MILQFQRMAPEAFLVALTQKRFQMYQETTQLESILNREDPNLGIISRRFILFDENPHLYRT